MTDMQARLAAEMAKLRNVYLAHLPVELNELSALSKTLTGTNKDRQTLDDLHNRLHKLAGSGGTFGFRVLSERARQLEIEIKALLNDEKLIEQTLLAQLSSNISSLSSSLGDVNIQQVGELESIESDNTEKESHLLWLVDDDIILGQELQRLLKQFGYNIRLFTRLDEVEQAAQHEQPDILILDVFFADEGIDSSKEMLSRPGLKTLRCPLIFISSQEGFPARLRAARLGAHGFLIKPLDVPKLVDQIEQIIEAGKKTIYRVLIVDDDETLSAHYRLVLMSAGMEVEVVNQPQQIIERASAFHPELILMDMNMPEYTGQEIAMVIRQHDKWAGLPIIYLSAESDIDEQIKAMGKGADDFLTKPISDTRLISAVSVRAKRARQMTNLISKDGLTGLIKHSRIKELLEIELLRAQRNKTPMSTVMIDIDHFKKVNDTYGHAVGDRVIRAIAHLLKQRVRKSDVVGRYGGEEFAAILPECQAETAQKLMDDIRTRFSTLSFYDNDNKEFRCTMSVGVACNMQHPELSSADLLAKADEALYQAKQGGRNQVIIAT